MKRGRDDGTSTECDEGAHAAAASQAPTESGGGAVLADGPAAAAGPASGGEGLLADERAAKVARVEVDATVWAESLDMCAAGECRLFMRARTQTRTHARTHARMHTHTHTHTHTRARARIPALHLTDKHCNIADHCLAMCIARQETPTGFAGCCQT
jgi:hypothetical protein